MQYIFKFGPEALWFVVVTVATAVLQFITAQGAAPPTDIGVWLVALGAAAVRALLGAILHLAGNQPA